MTVRKKRIRKINAEYRLVRKPNAPDVPYQGMVNTYIHMLENPRGARPMVVIPEHVKEYVRTYYMVLPKKGQNMPRKKIQSPLPLFGDKVESKKILNEKEIKLRPNRIINLPPYPEGEGRYGPINRPKERTKLYRLKQEARQNPRNPYLKTMPTKKTIDKKVFRKVSSHKTKTAAQNKAMQIRNNGNMARVVKDTSKSSFKHTVYKK